jgi:hypothetical protein
MEVRMLAALLPVLAPLLGDVIRRALPDPEAAAKAQAELNIALLANAAELERAGAGIVQAEAQGESWLQRNWRPILMLTFGSLIVARWLGYAAPNMTEAEALKLWDIIQLGLGGYVIGRSAEKILPAVAQAVRR